MKTGEKEKRRMENGDRRQTENRPPFSILLCEKHLLGEL